jgi:hypothetical protein
MSVAEPEAAIEHTRRIDPWPSFEREEAWFLHNRS